MEVGKNEACAYFVKANGTAIVLETTMFLLKIKLLQIFSWNFVKIYIYIYIYNRTLIDRYSNFQMFVITMQHVILVRNSYFKQHLLVCSISCSQRNLY